MTETDGPAGLIVHLNGWPGAGKKTVGLALAERLGARLIHNHLLHDVAIVVTGFDDPERWPLYETIRSAAYAALVRRPAGETFVMTNALRTNSNRGTAAWRDVVGLAIDRQVPLVPVVLEVEEGENVRRLGSADRQGTKLTDAEKLRDYRHTSELQYPDVPELLVLDTTTLAPREAAERIAAHVANCRPSLMPADARHLRLR